jgi:hypothetical protein
MPGKSNPVRGSCGRWSFGPWLPRYSRLEGDPWRPRVFVPGRLWDRLTGYRSLWACRKQPDHWKVVLVPPGEKWVKAVHDIAPVPPRGRRQLRLAALGKWKKVTRKMEWVKVPTRSVELGHRYSFSRRERR